MIAKIRKFIRLTHPEKWALLEACLYLTFSIIAVRLIPFRIISSYLGEHMAASPDKLDSRDEKIARHVSQAILQAKNNLPWKVVCLPMAMTAKIMLGRRGLKSTLYMGVNKKASGALRAHAWLRAGGLIVTGDSERSEFSVVARFS